MAIKKYLTNAYGLLVGIHSKLGLVLRKLNARQAGLRKGCFIGRGAELSISVRIRVTDHGRLVVSKGVKIDRYSDVTVKYGRLTIGRDTFIGSGTIICARDDVQIGDGCLIGEHVTIRDQDHKFGPGLSTSEAGFTTAPICVGKNVWIGAKSSITKGVTIGDNSVVAANSVVTHDVPPGVIVAGVPASILRLID